MREVLPTIEFVLAIIVGMVVMFVEYNNIFKSNNEKQLTDAQVLIKLIFKPTAFEIMTVLVFKLISLLF